MPDTTPASIFQQPARRLPRNLPRRSVTTGLLAGAVALAAAPAHAVRFAPVHSVTADLAGDGTHSTAALRRRGAKIRLEIRDAQDRRLASADVPCPASTDEYAVSAGSLGSAGALLSVSAAGSGSACVSLWRFRDGMLSRLPLAAGGTEIEPCAPAGEWSVRWESDGSEQRPAAFVRERTRNVPGGLHRQIDVFAFSGFRLERDPGRSRAEIRNVVIPSWFAADLYPRGSLDALAERFDLSRLKNGPRLRIESDPGRGVFDLRFRDASGELRVPVVKSEAREADSESGVELTGGVEATPVRAWVVLRRKSIPFEVRVSGAGQRFDGSYSPPLDAGLDRIEVYPTIEQAIASGVLPGTWAGERDERWDVRIEPGTALVKWGGQKFAVRLEEAPPAFDLVLLPVEGGDAAWGIVLKGQDGLVRRRLRCATPIAPGACVAEGADEALRRLGSAINVR